MAKAVLWGRNVFQSIRKFLQFQLVVNVVAVSLNFISAAAGITELPLAAVPLLWVNMIMDSMGALALATEPPSPHLMERKPFGRSAPLVNKEMWRNIVVMSLYQLIVCLVLLFAGQDLLGIDEGRGWALQDSSRQLRHLQRLRLHADLLRDQLSQDRGAEHL